MLAHVTGQIDGADLDRALLGKPAPDRLRHCSSKAPQKLVFAGQAFGRRDLRHRNGVLKSRLLDLERGRKREYRAPMLDSVAPPGGKAFAIPDAVDFIND